MFRTAAAFCTTLLALTAVSYAAEVTFKDGHVLEGEILAESDEVMVLDTRAGSSRATIRVQMSEVAQVVRSPLPSGFFDEDAPDPRAEEATEYRRGVERYLVVPIHGEFGKSVRANAIQRVVSYAWRHKVGHIVFDVDSEGLGDLDETLEIFELLDKYESRIQMHAIVSQARGSALAVVINCHTLHIKTGAAIGGSGQPLPEGPEAEELASVRDAVIARAVQIDRAHGRSGKAIEAMLDPELELYMWLGENGEPEMGRSAPEGADLVINCPRGEALVVTSSDFEKLKLGIYEGGAAELGAALDLGSWEQESEYRARTMARVAKAEAEEDAKESEGAARTERKVERAVERRDGIMQSLQHNLEQAKSWDPDEGEYETIQRHYSWAWGSYGSYGSSQETNLLTDDSRNEWQQRTDATVGYIKKALRDLRSLKSAEGRAHKLGVEPLVDDAEIERLQEQLKLKGKQLVANRDKEGN